MHNQSESRVKERGKKIWIFLLRSITQKLRLYFGSVDSSYQYLLGYANALYDCGLITSIDLQKAFDITEKLFEEFKELL